MNISFQFSDKITIDWVSKYLSDLVFPDLSGQKPRINTLFCGVLAVYNRKPIALILANATPADRLFRIHSFYVQPDFREKGIGSHLLERLEKEVKRKGTRKTEVFFRENWKSAKVLNKILRKQGWAKPMPHSIMLRGEISAVWKIIKRHETCNNAASFVPFSHLKKIDIVYIQKRQKNGLWSDPALDPFVLPDSILADCSFLVKRGGEPGAWIVVHQLQKELIEITALFVDSSFRQFGIAYELIRRAFSQLEKSAYSRFVVTSRLDGNAVSRLLVRNLKNEGFKGTVSYYTSKELGSGF